MMMIMIMITTLMIMLIIMVVMLMFINDDDGGHPNVGYGDHDYDTMVVMIKTVEREVTEKRHFRWM